MRVLAERDGLRFVEGLRTQIDDMLRGFAFHKCVVVGGSSAGFDDEPAFDVAELDLVAVLQHASAP